MDKGAVKTFILATTFLGILLASFIIFSGAAPLWAQGCVSTGTPAVSTDKDDYEPGETVFISGSGLQCEATLTVQISAPDGSVTSDEVIADNSGEFSHTYQIPLEYAAGEYILEVLDHEGNVLVSTLFYDTHFRYGHLTYIRTGNTSVNFTLKAAFRRGGYSCRAAPSTSISPCTGPNGRPGLGDYIWETIGGTNLLFGDSTSTGTLLFRVDAIDVAGDWLLGTALHPGTTNPFISKTYSSQGPFTAQISTCCRISTAIHINNRGASYRVQAIVNLTGSNSGNPVSSLPAIVDCPANAVCAFNIPAIDPDGDAITYRFSTFAESAISLQPGPPNAPNAATINREGLYVWNTAGASGGIGALYSTQVTMEERDASGNLIGKSAIDFFIRLVAGSPPRFDVPPTPGSGRHFGVFPGENINFTVRASDPDPGDTVFVGHLGLPPGATLVCGAAGNPTACTFDWTLGQAQVGDHVVSFVAQDQTGLNAPAHPITIRVCEEANPPLCVAAAQQDGAPSSLHTAFDHDPVNVVFGNFVHLRQDLGVPSRGLPTVFSRTYNSASASVNGPFGFGWTHSYNVKVMVETPTSVLVQNEDGRLDRYTSIGAGFFAPPAGIYDELVQHPDGSYTITRKDKRRYEFDASGRLLSISDRNGNAKTFTYDGAGNLVQITDTVGRVFTLGYDGAGRIINVTDPAGRALSYEYDANGNLAVARDLAGNPTAYSYDSGHRMVSFIDPMGNTVVTNTYDANGKVIEQRDALGNIHTFTYGSGETVSTNSRGFSTTYFFDTDHRITKVRDALGGEVTRTYDSESNLGSITDQRGNTTQFTYDARGNLTEVTNAQGDTTTFAYDGEDNLVSRTDPLSRTATFTYDASSNLVSSTNTLGAVSTLDYDSFGQLVSRTDPNGNTANFTYDGHGNLILITNPLGHTAVLEYDGIGQLIRQSDPLGNTASLTHDVLGRLISGEDPLGNSITFNYDPNGNVLRQVDPVGNATEYEYDVLNRLVKVRDAEGGVVSYGYDSVGNLISMTDANGHVTTSEYDALNRVANATDPLGRSATFAYDVIGNLSARVDALGESASFSYD